MATFEADAPTSSHTPPDWSLEAELWGLGYHVVAGVDEAGRGALAGPVVAAAVVLPVTRHPFVDSKTVGVPERERLAELVRSCALAWAVGEASAAEVDRVNVLAATKLAAERALRALGLRPDAIVTDYLPLDRERLASWGGPAAQRCPPRADGRSLQVAAASLVAKTHRDALMRRAAVRWPGYGFERNKGYGAPVHLEALGRQGPCPWHRITFRPVGGTRPGHDA
ncbi:MAG: ribonuclease HII [Trueperaceae bacterium]|nr:ribonuclease HII [Trueperaceae bacterium]